VIGSYLRNNKGNFLRASSYIYIYIYINKGIINFHYIEWDNINDFQITHLKNKHIFSKLKDVMEPLLSLFQNLYLPLTRNLISKN